MHCSQWLIVTVDVHFAPVWRGCTSTLFFFVFSGCEQCLPDFSPRKRQNSAQWQGLSRFFTISRHSALTKMGTQHDKITHSWRGQGRPFPSGISVNMGWVRGVWVIDPLFYYIYARAAGACHSRASEVIRLRATLAARAVSVRRQKLTSATQKDAPGCPLYSVAARSSLGGPVKHRRTVLSRTSLFSLLPPPNSAPVPDIYVKLNLVPEVLISSLLLIYSN